MYLIYVNNYSCSFIKAFLKLGNLRGSTGGYCRAVGPGWARSLARIQENTTIRCLERDLRLSKLTAGGEDLRGQPQGDGEHSNGSAFGKIQLTTSNPHPHPSQGGGEARKDTAREIRTLRRRSPPTVRGHLRNKSDREDQGFGGGGAAFVWEGRDV